MRVLSALVLAHQWGWDELLYFAVPVVAVLYWVRWAEKRAAARKAQERTGESEPAGGDS